MDVVRLWHALVDTVTFLSYIAECITERKEIAFQQVCLNRNALLHQRSYFLIVATVKSPKQEQVIQAIVLCQSFFPNKPNLQLYIETDPVILWGTNYSAILNP